MRRLVFLTQSVDPAHPVLAATIPKIRALAARVDEVVVLAQSGGGEGLPSNVDVRTFGAATQPGRAWRFERELARALPADAVVAHMIPGLRPAGCAAGASAPYPARPLVHALESLADVACRRATGDGDRQRRPPFVPARVGEGARDRARYRRERVRLHRPGRARGSSGARARTLFAGEGNRDDPARRAAGRRSRGEAARRGAERPGAPAPWGARRARLPPG